MPFKDISIFSPGGHFVQQSGMVCKILVEGIMRNFLSKYFEFWPVNKEEISKKILLF